MPEMSCLFARATPAAIGGLRADPVCGARLHRFGSCDGLTLAGEALAVVFLSGAVAPPWDPDDRSRRRPAEDWSQARALGLRAPPLGRLPWLEDALPPLAIVARWAALSREHDLGLAWWWWWERGDDLYADAAWLFAPDRQVIAARTTHLVGDAAGDLGFLYGPDGGPPTPLAEAPLELAMRHLGFESSLEYFVPTDIWRFDWSPHRVP
jgi:hypothetical protein